MSRLRIVCKDEPVRRHEYVSGYPVSVHRPATWSDTFLTLISDDGTEHPITNVSGVTYRAAQGSELATATLEFFDVDVELDVDLSPLERLAAAAREWASTRSCDAGVRLLELAAALPAPAVPR